MQTQPPFLRTWGKNAYKRPLLGGQPQSRNIAHSVHCRPWRLLGPTSPVWPPPPGWPAPIKEYCPFGALPALAAPGPHFPAALEMSGLRNECSVYIYIYTDIRMGSVAILALARLARPNLVFNRFQTLPKPRPAHT